MAEAFNHSLNADNVDEISGYSRAISQIFNYIQKETEFNPEKRFIDSVPLIDKIGATAKEISALYEEAKMKLKTIESRLTKQPG